MIERIELVTTKHIGTIYNIKFRLNVSIEKKTVATCITLYTFTIFVAKQLQFYFNRLSGTIHTVCYSATAREHEKEVILRMNWRFATK